MGRNDGRGNANTYSDAKVRETGVQGFKTIVEVQPAYRRGYRALRRDRASYLKLVMKDKQSAREYKNQEEIRRRMREETNFLLRKCLESAGVEYKEYEGADGEKRVGYMFCFDELYAYPNDGGLTFDNFEHISAFPDAEVTQPFIGYDLHLTAFLNKDKEFQVEVQLEEKGSLEIRHISKALCVLFPKTYQGLGIPAIMYKQPRHIREVGMLNIAPLSRLPQVREHIRELGKELSPRLQDLEELLSEMRRVSDRNTKMAKQIRHTLHREYLYTLLEAMGRGI